MPIIRVMAEFVPSDALDSVYISPATHVCLGSEFRLSSRASSALSLGAVVGLEQLWRDLLEAVLNTLV
jgi:hypothetical protein